MKYLILFSLVFLFSCNPKSHPENPVSNYYQKYLALKDALVESDVQAAQSAATDLLSEKNNIENIAGKEGSAIIPLLETIAKSEDLEEQRKTFSSLSDIFIQIAENHKSELGSVYVQYCPMALDDKGAYWLSDEEEIMNPYFGDEMLHCGEVKRKIE